MSKVPRQLGLIRFLTFMAIVTSGCVFAQEAPSSGTTDIFASFRTTLSEAADRTLAGALANQAWMKPMRQSATVAMAPSMIEGGPVLKLRAAVDRVNQLRPTLEPILRGEGVPVELSAVVLVESGGMTSALSPKGARGLWQLMPDTARRYGLVVDERLDDRTDVIKSTHAAARYLRDLHAKFGEWPLALAAYNAGELVVTNAMSHVSSRDVEWLSRNARLPLETRRYVPAVNAAVRRLHDGSSWLIPDQNENNHVAYASSGSGE